MTNDKEKAYLAIHMQNEQNNEQESRSAFGNGRCLLATSIGAIAGYWMISHYMNDDDEGTYDPFKGTLDYLMHGPVAEASGKHGDKHLDKAMNQIDDGVKDLLMKHPQMKRPMLSSGYRGTRYYIEFPVTGKNVDAFSILIAIQNVLSKNKKDA